MNVSKNRPTIAEANIMVLKAGFHYGETVELLDHTYQVQPAKLPAMWHQLAIGRPPAKKIWKSPRQTSPSPCRRGA